MMQEAFERDEKTRALPDEFLLEEVPRSKWQRNIPKLPGQNTQQFDTWKYHQQQCRHTLHVECNKAHTELTHYLCERAKKLGIIERMWGKQVHYRRVCDEGTSRADVKKIMKEANHQVNFHSSMTSDALGSI